MRDQEGLFEAEPVEPKRSRARAAGVDKKFRAFDPGQVLLLPPSLDDWLPEDHLARFVADLVDVVLDLSPILADYTEKRGFPPYDPRLMVRLLIYGYTTGVRSSRAIERKCVDDVAFRFLAADQAPDFRSIARFRRRHLDALADLFLQSLHLAQKLGMVKMGRVALDGTKLEANASKHKAMSYGRLIDKEERIEAEIASLEATAAALLADAVAEPARPQGRPCSGTPTLASPNTNHSPSSSASAQPPAVRQPPARRVNHHAGDRVVDGGSAEVGRERFQGEPADLQADVDGLVRDRFGEAALARARGAAERGRPRRHLPGPADGLTHKAVPPSAALQGPLPSRQGAAPTESIRRGSPLSHGLYSDQINPSQHGSPWGAYHRLRCRPEGQPMQEFR